MYSSSTAKRKAASCIPELLQGLENGSLDNIDSEGVVPLEEEGLLSEELDPTLLRTRRTS